MIEKIYFMVRKTSLLNPCKIIALTLLFQMHYVALGQKEPVDYVNVFTGTSNTCWILGPYAGVLYGMVPLSPDNQESGWIIEKIL